MAESRENPSSEPVTTTVMPSRVRSTDASRSSAISHAGGRPLVDDLRVPVDGEPLDHRVGDDPADPLGPGQLLGRSVAAPDRVHRGELLRERPGRGGADVPDRQRHDAPATAAAAWPSRGCRRAASPLADSTLPSTTASSAVGLLGRPGEQRHRASELLPPRRPARTARSRPRARRTRAAPPPPPSPAPRCRTRRDRPARPAAPAAGTGRSARWGSGCPCRPPSRGPAGCRTRGTTVGMTNSRSLPSRRSTTGPRISGMTSPALRSTTVSPIRTPLRRTSSALCRVARSTVDPATTTGSITPNGVTRPVRPTLTWMSRSVVLTSSGGYLNAIAHRGAREVDPSLALDRDLVDLDDDAVELVLDAVPLLAVLVDELLHPLDRVEHPVVRRDRQAPLAEQVVGLATAGSARSPRAGRCRAPASAGRGSR